MNKKINLIFLLNFVMGNKNSFLVKGDYKISKSVKSIQSTNSLVEGFNPPKVETRVQIPLGAFFFYFNYNHRQSIIIIKIIIKFISRTLCCYCTCLQTLAIQVVVIIIH